MINAQLHTLNPKANSGNFRFGTAEQSGHRTISAMMAMTRSFFHPFSSSLVPTLTKRISGKVLAEKLLRNRLVTFIFKRVIYLAVACVALCNRIVEDATKVLSMTTEAFFRFMDDFFMMDDDPEVVLITTVGAASGQKPPKHNETNHQSRRLFTDFHPYLKACDYHGHGSEGGVKKTFDLFMPLLIRYFRLHTCRPLNLFKPIAIKLPLKHLFNARQTPV